MTLQTFSNTEGVAKGPARPDIEPAMLNVPVAHLRFSTRSRTAQNLLRRPHPQAVPTDRTPNAPLSVGVVRLDNIGDHVLGSGFLKGLRENLANASITLFVTKKTVPLYSACPYIDHCVVLQGERGVECHPELRPFVGKFDLLVNPRFAHDYYGAATIVRQLAAKRSITFSQVDDQTTQHYTETLAAPLGVHVAEYANELVQHLFPGSQHYVPETWKHPIDRLGVEIKLSQQGWSGSDLVLLAAGASAPHRVWPEFRVMGLIDEIVSSFKCHVMVVGARGEQRRYRTLARRHHPRIINGLGIFSLPQLAACCQMGALFVGTDSGPKHIAAANGLRVVEINHMPASMESRICAAWPTGDNWAAYGVENVQVRPAGLFSEADIIAGKTIAAVTENQVMQEVDRFLRR
ncbi:MAG: glycosyltransferase family 9 protein [Pseudomonadota bacterium]